MEKLWVLFSHSESNCYLNDRCRRGISHMKTICEQTDTLADMTDTVTFAAIRMQPQRQQYFLLKMIQVIYEGDGSLGSTVVRMSYHYQTRSTSYSPHWT